MVFATLILLCAIPPADDAAKAAATSSASIEHPSLSPSASDNASKDTAKDTPSPASLPSAPEPKAKAEVEPASSSPASQPLRPVLARPHETPGQRKIWYGLMVAGHSGAAFDAWTTRRAVSGGYGQESNPFLRPFANSNVLYAATQVSPAFMDFLGKRMMTSRTSWVRKMWWVPQVAGTSLSFAAAAHNMTVVH